MYTFEDVSPLPRTIDKKAKNIFTYECTYIDTQVQSQDYFQLLLHSLCLIYSTDVT